MKQLAWFAEAGQSKELPTEYIEYFPKLIDGSTGQHLLGSFIKMTPWKQQLRLMYTLSYCLRHRILQRI
jgi:hypothetical protein